jgi:AraC-like DNA-binding protein
MSAGGFCWNLRAAPPFRPRRGIRGLRYGRGWRRLTHVANERRSGYRPVQFGVETLDSGILLPRHRHAGGYATVVLAGSFEEAGFAGRFVVRPGDVLLHGAFDCHANRPLTRLPITILRLPWSDNLLEGHFRVPDPDVLALLAERDPAAAAAQLRSQLIRRPPAELHWTERLQQTLNRDTCVRLEHWAEAEDLAPETVSRGFRRAFGVAPKVFRLESRARQAWNSIRGGTATLTEVALEFGFSDLPHLTRAVRALTGSPPSFWQLRSTAGALARQVHSS